MLHDFQYRETSRMYATNTLLCKRNTHIYRDFLLWINRGKTPNRKWEAFFYNGSMINTVTVK